VAWVHLAQSSNQGEALVNMVMNLQVPYKAGNFLTSSVNISLSRRTLFHVEASQLQSPNTCFSAKLNL